MPKRYTAAEHPEHKLVKAAMRAGLHNVIFTQYKSTVRRPKIIGWELQCDQLKYHRFLHDQNEIVKLLKNGVLIDEGTKFKIGTLK